MGHSEETEETIAAKHWEQIIAEALADELKASSSTGQHESRYSDSSGAMAAQAYAGDHPEESIRAIEAQNARWAAAARESMCAQLRDHVKHNEALPTQAAWALHKVLRGEEGELLVIESMTGLSAMAERALLRSGAAFEAFACFEQLQTRPRITLRGVPRSPRGPVALEEPSLTAEVARRTRGSLEESTLLLHSLANFLFAAPPSQWGALTLERMDDVVLGKLTRDDLT
jgi:hypothetical protein